MSNDIHPHWKSTSAGGGGVPDERTEELLKRIAAPKQHIKVKPNSGAHPFALILGAVSTIGVLGFVFIHGVSFLQAALMQEFESQELERTIPFAVSLDSSDEKGDMQAIEINPKKSQPSVVQQPSALKKIPDTEPKLVVPDDSIPLLPTLPKAVPTPAPKVSIPNPAPPARLPTSHKVSAPTIAVHPTPTAPQVVDLGNAAAPQMAADWPSALRINRYTVGSSFVPASSPMQQITAGSIGQPQNIAHAAAPGETYPRAASQPSTGQELWVVCLLSLGALTLLRRSTSH